VIAMSVAEHGILTKVLVAVGGSEASFSALNYAIDLAQAGGQRTNVLIVQEVLITSEMALAGGENLGRLVEQLAAAVQQTTEQTEHRVRELATRRGSSVNISRSTGHVGDSVVAAAANASLLILGRQGHNVVRSGLLGSNTESIVRRTHRPLLIAPAQHRRIRRVLVAYGGKDLGGLALTTGCEIAEALGVPPEVLTVAQKPPDGAAIQERAKRSLLCNGSGVTFSIESGDPATSIINHCARDTLVVMGAYGHSRLYHMVLGSVTEQVVRFTQGPVLLSAKQGAAAAK